MALTLASLPLLASLKCLSTAGRGCFKRLIRSVVYFSKLCVFTHSKYILVKDMLAQGCKCGHDYLLTLPICVTDRLIIRPT